MTATTHQPNHQTTHNTLTLDQKRDGDEDVDGFTPEFIGHDDPHHHHHHHHHLHLHFHHDTPTHHQIQPREKNHQQPQQQQIRLHHETSLHRDEYFQYPHHNDMDIMNENQPQLKLTHIEEMNLPNDIIKVYPEFHKDDDNDDNDVVVSNNDISLNTPYDYHGMIMMMVDYTNAIEPCCV